ncbi:MAG: nonstructural protein [Arizlama microvirus]|nr:MAG: nonstructural protein [Arizlama microvirus]
MKLKVFAVYDSKAEQYKPPFVLSTKGLALRSWAQLLEDENTDPSKFPADFTLFELGEYDDSNGKMLPHPTPLSLGTGLEHKTQKTSHPFPSKMAL